MSKGNVCVSMQPLTDTDLEEFKMSLFSVIDCFLIIKLCLIAEHVKALLLEIKTAWLRGQHSKHDVICSSVT